VGSKIKRSDEPSTKKSWGRKLKRSGQFRDSSAGFSFCDASKHAKRQGVSSVTKNRPKVEVGKKSTKTSFQEAGGGDSGWRWKESGNFRSAGQGEVGRSGADNLISRLFSTSSSFQYQGKLSPHLGEVNHSSFSVIFLLRRKKLRTGGPVGEI